MTTETKTESIALMFTMDQARQMVLHVYPGAAWVTDLQFGRIVDGDRLISLPIPLVDPEAEQMAWLDASQRLGDGNGWRANQGGDQSSPHLPCVKRTNSGGFRRNPRRDQSPSQ